MPCFLLRRAVEFYRKATDSRDQYGVRRMPDGKTDGGSLDPWVRDR
jgi:hypothetical protein